MSAGSLAGTLKRSVVLVGATGLVGGECLRLLLADPAFARVVVLARRPLSPGIQGPTLDAHVVEGALGVLGFRSLSIVRPSLLAGERAEFRLGEPIFQRLGFLVPDKYKPVHARDVAAALVRLAKEGAPGRRVVDSAEIRAWARAARSRDTA